MLRLIVEQITQWVDSRGRTRSALEEFESLLDQGAIAALEDALLGEFTPWHLGVLTDGWPISVNSKPIDLAKRDVGAPEVVCYAVGHEYAADYFEELAPFWTPLVAWLRRRHDESRIVLAQEVWHPEGNWCDIGRAITDSLLGGVSLDLTSTQRRGVYTAQPLDQQLNELIATWWPDAGGMLGGVTYRGQSWHEADRAFASGGRISADVLRQVDQVFVTTPTFDELGFAVLSRNDRWDEAQMIFSRCGWMTGTPIELLSSLP